jgi:hypothetical protein
MFIYNPFLLALHAITISTIAEIITNIEQHVAR